MRRGGRTAEEFAALPEDHPDRKFQLLRIIEEESEEDFPGELFLTPEELAFFVDTFERTGFTGGINWYRNIDRNQQRAPEVGVRPLELPCLMVTAEWDPALAPAMAANMPNLCRDLEMKMIEKCGHWTQQERPDELNAILLDWLGRRRADLS